MSVTTNPEYEAAMTMIQNPSDTATSTPSHPCQMSELWTALSFRQDEHAENVLKRMQEYMECRKFCDVVLVAGNDGRRVSAHRLILAATSEYFANLFVPKEQTSTEVKENESEVEEELSTTELAENNEEVFEPEEVIFVGLIRRKGCEEDEEFVTMQGLMQLKSKQQDNSEVCFTGILSRNSRLEEEEEAEEVKCSKDFYNRECKKLEEQELPHCLELGPGEYFRSYPQIVSHEINSSIVKSIDALCLEAKLEPKDEVVQPNTVDPTKQVETLSELKKVSFEVDTTKSLAEANFITTPPNEYLDPLLTVLNPINTADPTLGNTLINNTLTSNLKANTEPQTDQELPKRGVMIIDLGRHDALTSTKNGESVKNDQSNKEVIIANSIEEQVVDKKKLLQPVCHQQGRMKGGGVGSEEDSKVATPTKTGTILPRSTEDKKTIERKAEIKNQKQLRASSHQAEFHIRDKDKPLCLSLRYETKDKEVSLTGTLKEEGRNDYKLTRLGGEVLQQQKVEKKEVTVREYLSGHKGNSKNDTKLTRLGTGGGGAFKQHVGKNQNIVSKTNTDPKEVFLNLQSISNWLENDAKCRTDNEREDDMLPSTSPQQKSELSTRESTRESSQSTRESSENTSKQNFKEMLEVWKREDWKNEEIQPIKSTAKKTKKDCLGSLCRKFERKEKVATPEVSTSTLPVEKKSIGKVVICDKLAGKHESKLGKIKERLRHNLFSSQGSSKREDFSTKRVESIGKHNISSKSTIVRQKSGVEIKHVSIEYIAEEAQMNKIIPRSWLRRSKHMNDDMNFSKLLTSITEEDEHISDEHTCDKSKKDKSINSAELKLLRSWRCINEDEDKSSDPLNYSVCSDLPADLELSRKPVNSIIKKSQDTRTLAELFHDLINMEERENQASNAKVGLLNEKTILDSILRENLEEHAAALCDDINIQKKVNERMNKKKPKDVISQTTLQPEEEFMLPEPQTNIGLEMKQQGENLLSEHSVDDDEAIAALVNSNETTLVQLPPNKESEVMLEPTTVVTQAKIETAAIVPEEKIDTIIKAIPEEVLPPDIPKRKVEPLLVIEEKEISAEDPIKSVDHSVKQKPLFEPKKYWYVPEDQIPIYDSEKCWQTLKMLNSQTKKKSRSKHTKVKEVTLDSVNGATLQLLVNYCYSGNIEFEEENTAKNVLATAGMLKLNEIVRECTNFLARKLHPSNCLGVVNFAQEHNFKHLYEEAKDYASRHFVEVCKYNEFFELTANQLAQILSSDELNLPCEEEAFNCIISWLQYDRDNRVIYMPLLLPQLRLPLMEPSFILKYVEPVFAASSPECHRLVIEALKWHLLPSVERQFLPCELIIKPRKSKVPWHNDMSKLMAIGYNISEKTITLESYSATLNKWNIDKRKRLLPGRKGYGVAVIDKELLIIGGYEDWEGAKALNTVLSLDLQSLSWTLLQPMNECRYGAAVTVLNGFVYVLGGGNYYRTEFLNTVERWDSETYTWSSAAPMGTRRIYAGAVVLDNLLYVVGGSNETEYLSSMECYDPYRDEWTFKASMSEGRSECGVAAAHGYIYVVGGFSNGSRTKTVERYNPIMDTWTRVCSLDTARSCCSCATLGNRLLTVGGYDEIGVSLRSAEEYNINMDLWEPFPSMTSRYFSIFVTTIMREMPKHANCFRYGDNEVKSKKPNKFRNCIVKN